MPLTPEIVLSDEERAEKVSRDPQFVEKLEDIRSGATPTSNG
ncbi:hypothetical protein DSC_01385 [Pseudoxanthomonas spadix BD-a59]|uniref:Uncharacterized protein n=1 Tax=Pseudoxanthomonas spadix (strain BD-a59) TaxID=1045855 RepID=G7UTM9_PSEUP|nr:hypothetical protein DSC_01385 [Pseudoxanthomonas spadix BD-a59]